MGLSIAVCIKPVPDPAHYDKIRIDPVRKTVVREGIPTIINPSDKHAIEAALQLRGEGDTVTVITMAPPNAEETLRDALAMGADAAILLTDRAFAGADTWATSYTLAAGLKKAGGFDIVVTGTESADGATTQVPAQLAEWLGWPHLWNAVSFEKVSGESLKVRTKAENEWSDYQIGLPCLLAVSREANKPRLTSLMGVMKAKKKPLTVWTRADLDVEDGALGIGGSPTQPGAIFEPEMGRKGIVLTGDAEEIVNVLVEKLREAGLSIETGDVCGLGGGSV
ncbi:MAG: electron transfer flavoprotein subunit beta/FixA family protein [Veillonellaceae bacterium]|nr:electron transfer flavoprotein subunit beta/FixA family protein [Veillonellaceae bacterium]